MPRVIHIRISVTVHTTRPCRVSLVKYLVSRLSLWTCVYNAFMWSDLGSRSVPQRSLYRTSNTQREVAGRSGVISMMVLAVYRE